MIDAILNQFSAFYEAYRAITIPLFLVVGLSMAFYGLVINRIIAGIIGFLWGGIIGVVLGFLLGGQIGALIGFILFGAFFAGGAVWIAENLPKLLGFFASYLPVVLICQPDGWGHIIPLAAGLLGGWFGGFLNRSFIIVASSLTGAWLTTGSLLRLYGEFDSHFYGDIFAAFAHYSLVGVLVFSAVVLSGILKQYGVYTLFAPLDSFFYGFGSKAPELPEEENKVTVFLRYCLYKKELDDPSRGFAWMHAFCAGWLALTFVVLVPTIFVLSSSLAALSGDSVVLGWIQLKGILSIGLAAYFGIAFYLAIRVLNKSSIPQWAVRFVFQLGVVLTIFWTVASLVPLSQGTFDIDIVLVLFLLIPMFLQYQHDSSMAALSDAT